METVQLFEAGEKKKKIERLVVSKLPAAISKSTDSQVPSPVYPKILILLVCGAG